MYYPVGPSSVTHQKSLFYFALLRLQADAHNLEGVIEMLFFHGLTTAKRFWVPAGKQIEYRPINEEIICEQRTAKKLEEVGVLMEEGLLKLQKPKQFGS